MHLLPDGCVTVIYTLYTVPKTVDTHKWDYIHKLYKYLDPVFFLILFTGLEPLLRIWKFYVLWIQIQPHPGN